MREGEIFEEFRFDLMHSFKRERVIGEREKDRERVRMKARE